MAEQRGSLKAHAARPPTAFATTGTARNAGNVIGLRPVLPAVSLTPV